MFTPYYILAVGFGALATIVSVIGFKFKKDDPNFPGKLAVPFMLTAAVLGVATLVMVWRGGEKEQEHQREEQKHAEEEAEASTGQLPVGIALRAPSS